MTIPEEHVDRIRDALMELFEEKWAREEIAQPGTHVFLDGKTVVVSMKGYWTICSEPFSFEEWWQEWNREYPG